MNSVLDGIGTDSDTSAASGDGEPKVKRRAISLKVVVVLKPWLVLHFLIVSVAKIQMKHVQD